MKNILSVLTAILRVDGYKPSQWVQTPTNTTGISSYIESRGGAAKSVFFGPQAFIKEYLLVPITVSDVKFAKAVFAIYGAPFNEEGWMTIVNEYGGFLPLEIEAVPEGTYMETRNVQVQVTATDDRLAWLTSYVETALLRGVWYPSTVASESREYKVMLLKGLYATSDIPIDVLRDVVVKFSLHDFGARGASSSETAVLGGMSHLVNFWGTDTVEGLIGAYSFYNADITSADAPPVGRTVPASEHSAITSWGRANEAAAFENMIDQFSEPGSIYACVSDSFDIYNATSNIWGTQLKDKVIASGGTLVVRPDSGDPLTMPIKVLEMLAEKFGYTVNSKGYKVLAVRKSDGSPIVKVIQGDGLDKKSLPILIANIISAGFSLENIAFGMGGGLLQNVNRDTLKYAMKASAIRVGEGDWVGFSKDPVTDPGKKSKEGRLGLIYTCGIGSCSFKTVPKHIADEKGKNVMRVVYRNGKLLVDDNFETVRARAEVQEIEFTNEPVERY